MEYRFELRHNGVTIRSESKTFSSGEPAVEHAVAFAVKNAVPDSKVWVLTQDGVVLVLGVRAAKAVQQHPSIHHMRRGRDASALKCVAS